jgi:hypothetical protein
MTNTPPASNAAAGTSQNPSRDAELERVRFLQRQAGRSLPVLPPCVRGFDVGGVVYVDGANRCGGEGGGTYLAKATVLASCQPSRKPVCRGTESASDGMIFAETRALSITASLPRSVHLAATLDTVSAKAQTTLIPGVLGRERGLSNVDAGPVGLTLLIGMGRVNAKRHDNEQCRTDPHLFVSHGLHRQQRQSAVDRYTHREAQGRRCQWACRFQPKAALGHKTGILVPGVGVEPTRSLWDLGILSRFECVFGLTTNRS